MATKKQIEEGVIKHRKTMSGCATVEEWGRRFLRKGKLTPYKEIFDKVKEEQGEINSKRELLSEALSAAVDNVHKDFSEAKGD